MYETKPELWDPTNTFYHMRNKKHDAWTEIAKGLESDVNVIKGKMASLLSSFRREKVKMKQSLKTGTGKRPFFKDHDVAEPLSDSEAEADCSVETESVPSKQNSESEVQETPSASPIPSTSQHSPSGPTRKRKLFLSPKRKLPLKKKSTEDDPRVAYAYDMLKNITETPKNECTTFGEHIATKLAKFKDPVRSVVIYKINNIIFDAEIGKYNNYIDNIGVNEPSSPSSAHFGHKSNFNYSRRAYNSENLPSPNSNYNYSHSSYILQTNIPSPNCNSNYSCGSYTSQTNITPPPSNSNHLSPYNPQLGTLGQSQLGTTEDQTPQNNLTPLQALVQSFDPSNSNTNV
nr:unnamed protein product [Callosobruchus analis]